MFEIRAGAPPRGLDYVKSTSRPIVRWNDTRPFVVMEGRRYEQTPAIGGLGAGPKDDLIGLRDVFGPAGPFP